MEKLRPTGATSPSDNFAAPERGPAAFLRRILDLSPTAALLVAGVVLPNLLTFATLGSVIDIGLPPRTGCILMYCVLAICARRLPFLVTALLFLLVLAFDLIWTISLSFGLRPQELVAAINHARHLRLFDSPLYALMIGVLAATSAGTLYILSHRKKLQQGNVGLLFAAALAFAGLDYMANISPHYAYGALLGSSVPVESAVKSSGFAAAAGENGRNVVLVIVESLGYLNDPTARRRIDAPLFNAAIAQTYKITTGKIDYYGSTTSGEMRELCNTREPYDELTPEEGRSCLPERLRAHGYATMAVHGFTREFFERDEWYPVVGFDKEVFGEKLVPQARRLCGSAFRGACDADLPPVIAREAGFSAKPKFIYWLTLNTHIPVAPGQAFTRFGCSKDPGVFAHADVCNLAELWRDVFRAVAQLATDPRIAPAEIVVVGDHAPPLWSRRARAQFEPGKVPWYLLTPRDGVIAVHPAQQSENATP